MAPTIHNPSRHMSARAGKAQHLSRSNITACLRCRQKKKRCDQRLPSCSLCEVTGSECVGFDAVARRCVPRSYLLSLEERVAYLELKLQKNGVQYNNFEESPRPTTNATYHESTESPESGVRSAHDVIHVREISDAATAASTTAAVDEVRSLMQHTAEEEYAFSKAFLGELVTTKPLSNPDRGTKPDQTAPLCLPGDVLGDLDDLVPVLLPDQKAGESLVKIYFLFTNQGMPLLHEPSFRHQLDLVYASLAGVNLTGVQTTSETKVALFFVLQVFAISLVIAQQQDSKVPLAMADRYHRTALQILGEVGLPNGVDGVQALLLIAQFSYFHPTRWNCSKTLSIALVMTTELGLHKEPALGDMDFLAIDIRRRVFWVAYLMERSLAVSLSMPSYLPDTAITAKFPSEVDDDYILPHGIEVTGQHRFWAKSLSTHLFRYYQLLSEIRTVLYERPFLDPGLTNLDQWQHNMHNRLRQWYDESQHGENLTSYQKGDRDCFELNLNRALLHLYYPSTNVPNPRDTNLLLLSETATKVINLYRRFFRERKLSIYWSGIECVRSAGTALLYSYVHSPAVRARISFSELESLVSKCSSALWGMVERFPTFKGKRDAFDIVAAKTLADLVSKTTATSRGSTSSSMLDSTRSREANDILVDGGSTTTVLGIERQPQMTQWHCMDMDEGQMSTNRASTASLNSSLVNSSGFDSSSNDESFILSQIDDVFTDAGGDGLDHLFFGQPWM